MDILEKKKKLKKIKLDDLTTVDNRPGFSDLMNNRSTRTRRINEILSLAGRRKMSRSAKIRKVKLRRDIKKIASRTADVERIKRRAKRRAIRAIYGILSKGKDKRTLSSARKADLEKRISSSGWKARVIALTRRTIPKTRHDDATKRISGK